jgi:hypothetical protein
VKTSEQYIEEIEALSSNEEYHPTPNAIAITTAKAYVDYLAKFKFDVKFLPSGEGGVAIAFIGNGDKRGIIEILNVPDELDESNEYVILYSYRAGSNTLTFPIHKNYKYTTMELLNIWLDSEN